MSQIVFPRIERIRVPIPAPLRARLEAFIREKGWTLEEGAKILLAYGADELTDSELTLYQVYNLWAVARAEFSALRHRAYLADEAVRTLQLNITGLTASNAQFERSLTYQQARLERLRQALAERATSGG